MRWHGARHLRTGTRAPRSEIVSSIESLIPPGVAAAVGVTFAFLLAGIAWPHAADGLLRVLLTILAVGFVADRASRVVPPVIDDPYSPFARRPRAPRPPGAPPSLRSIISDLQAAGSRPATGAGIPAAVRTIVAQEAASRLLEHHGLRVQDPLHHARIESLVSVPTWRLIRSHDPHARAGVGLPTGPSLALSQLVGILDDVESL